MGRRDRDELNFDEEEAPPARSRRRGRRRARESEEEMLKRLAARRKLEEMWEAKRLKYYLRDVFADYPDA